MKNKGVWFLAATLVFLFFTLVYQNISKNVGVSRVYKNVQTSFNASCVVSKNGVVRGAGVLLDTGYIITAKHVVDLNNDNRISENERKFSVEFMGDNRYFYPVVVFHYSEDKDFAFLKLDGPVPIPGVKVAKLDGLMGQPVFTIGATNSGPLIMSSGYIAEVEGKRNRMSCYISGGNSGGGLFNSSNELLGIIVTVNVKNQMLELTIPIPDENMEFAFVDGYIVVRDELNGVGGFVNLNDIRVDLIKQNLTWLLDAEEEPLNPYMIGFVCLGVLYVLRRVVFGKTMFRVRRNNAA